MKRESPPPELLMAYLDGELPPKKQKKFEDMLQSHPEWREEVAEMADLVKASGRLKIKPPSTHYWDNYWEEIDSQLHRHVGWWISLMGAILLFAVGMWKILTYSENTFFQLGILMVALGFLILFGMVLWGRYREMPKDRYERIRR